MNFRPRQKEEPEINLIPFIDVLLVILIFLMLTTTYSKFTEVQLRLPVADTDVQRDYPKEIIVTVTNDGRYTVKGNTVLGRNVEAVAQALSETQPQKDSVIIITADAAAPHQAVITVMEAARRVGLSQITFATQNSAHAGTR
ncbi:ExbD/TolR family protein [Ramlibacter sp. PS4R-6]|uniref:ExbD/TolR family protein n=1 Tax=Ramlibacter sp. PS4R-6 TaxID=3133438 RepID=UPI00309C6E19